MTGPELESSGRNYLGFLEGDDGYCSFIRFTGEQLRVYGEDPLFRNLSMCSSGVYLSLVTDGDRLSFDCRTLELVSQLLPAIAELGWDGVKEIIRGLSKKIEQGAPLPRQREKFDLVTDDGQRISRMPKNGHLSFEFRNCSRRAMKLRLYFPVFPYVALRRLESNGRLEPGTATLPCILCLGDSITQGFNAVHPSLTWTSRLADLLGVDALNQGVGGYYFDAASLEGLEGLAREGPSRPALVTVAYGTNDWDLVPGLSTLRERARAYFARLAGLFPGVPAYVLTPIWRGDLDKPKACGSFGEVARAIAEEAGRYPGNRVVDGLSIPIQDRKYFQDNWLHPNEEGFRIMADRLFCAIGPARAAEPGSCDGSDVASPGSGLPVAAPAPR